MHYPKERLGQPLRVFRFFHVRSRAGNRMYAPKRWKHSRRPALRRAGNVSARRTEAIPRMVDLGAGRCLPCRKMAPILLELRSEYAGRADVVFIDVWERPDLASGYSFRAIPTQIVDSWLVRVARSGIHRGARGARLISAGSPLSSSLWIWSGLVSRKRRNRCGPRLGTEQVAPCE